MSASTRQIVEGRWHRPGRAVQPLLISQRLDVADRAKRIQSGVGTTTSATTPPFKQPIRSASTTFGTPPSTSKH